ncbi:NADH dehydrogenase subunit J [Rhodothalassium salexigens DSM 2132]|uniref:NADH-quinone oxidoreductase subunit J n=1 Tax=Rhodothalassium salexigens DSM 2132 TaxID=1188247 RepID=A0A4R2PRB1_RHOSA|nr:NADH-quinone oxidoreductase subunit J [Rhodothalassium salexigens]MBB4210195.1 NADH-quinone oxidoreductase subunit J [Rhodothalassium salexigens DSM 2132]MBK1638541.1 NADH:ubiquinone oxidoreductase subunit J [Rhodothalassium salexigens DSM 2132]TCP38359.1 NADH dehydrogenase subunit J [Rhodothalassium salexigens DSM 2132]
MSLTAIVFYVLSSVTVLSAVMVIAARNPVHSVLFLILAFFNSAGLFVLLGAELLAMLLVIVYVGAVAVLFLFVVMMLDINFVRLREGFLRYFPIGVLIGAVLAAELVFVVGTWVLTPEMAGNLRQPTPEDVTNTRALGQLIYTDYVFVFQTAGMILLTAMIGAIVLTLRKRPGVKRQNIAQQLARSPETAIEIKKVKTGEGI